ncbi:NAD(P)-dependent dehydrogenase (short-subunit alcohol dehydrogenase family) [Arthrobacter bambusae]|uniref:NAD(P)-dependent dehydrogenase (Short-subunit alcohol dehydrogenase family) n=1 Tax=Arthrobacter bambusae TaxID=1338426 RepID=A0ABV2P1W2_9MICC
MKNFKNKVAVVTGGASGIGFAMAERFSAEGMHVVVADIEEAALDAAVDRLHKVGSSILGVQTDVSDAGSVRKLADETMEAFGRVDVLCNNAGVETGGTFLGIPERAWEWVMDVNFFGVLNGCRTFLPLLAQRDEAHIVNTASVAAFASGTATMIPYCASKMAILGLSESLEVELRTAGSPVGVSVLAPGPVKTNMPQAERNRPADVPAASEPARLATLERLSQLTEEKGLEPSAVADMVMSAIRANDFFILPHPELALAGVRKRLQWMETGQPPAIRQAGT